MIKKIRENYLKLVGRKQREIEGSVDERKIMERKAEEKKRAMFEWREALGCRDTR